MVLVLSLSVEARGRVASPVEVEKSTIFCAFCTGAAVCFPMSGRLISLAAHRVGQVLQTELFPDLSVALVLMARLAISGRPRVLLGSFDLVVVSSCATATLKNAIEPVNA